MFKLARGRPIAAAFRAATVSYSPYPIGPSFASCPLTRLLSDLGVVLSSGSAAEAKSVYSRVPVCASSEAGMLDIALDLLVAHLAESFFFFSQVGPILKSDR